MSIMAKLLDRCRKAQSLSSDSALADVLRISRQTVSQYRNGSVYPEEDRFIELCDAARVDSGAWLNAMRAERATGLAQQRWMDAAKKLGYAAALFLAVYTAIPGTANAARALPYSSADVPMAVYYVHFWKRLCYAF